MAGYTSRYVVLGFICLNLLTMNHVESRSSICSAKSLLQRQAKDCLKPIASMRRVFGEEFEHFALRLCDINRKVEQCIKEAYKGCPGTSLSRDPSYIHMQAEVEAATEECQQLKRKFAEQPGKYKPRKPR